MAMGGVIDRYRSSTARRRPALGVLSVADAWACTNPSMGRGMSLGLAHAALLRRVVREHGERPADLVAAFAADDRARAAAVVRQHGARRPRAAGARSTRCATARRRRLRSHLRARRARSRRRWAATRTSSAPRWTSRPASHFRRTSSRGPGSPSACWPRRRRDAVRLGPDRRSCWRCWLMLEQHLRQRAVVLERLRPVPERLQADVVGAGVEVGADRLGDRAPASRAGSPRRSAGRCRRPRCRAR